MDKLSVQNGCWHIITDPYLRQGYRYWRLIKRRGEQLRDYHSAKSLLKSAMSMKLQSSKQSILASSRGILLMSSSQKNLETQSGVLWKTYLTTHVRRYHTFIICHPLHSLWRLSTWIQFVNWCFRLASSTCDRDNVRLWGLVYSVWDLHDMRLSSSSESNWLPNTPHLLITSHILHGSFNVLSHTTVLRWDCRCIESQTTARLREPPWGATGP